MKEGFQYTRQVTFVVAKSRLVRYLLSSAILAAVYFAFAKMGLALAPVSGFATVVWAPSGISLAALFLWGYRLWPGIALGAFLVNFQIGAPWFSALAIAAGNCFEALSGTWLLSRIAKLQNLERVRTVIALILTALSVTLISSSIGVTFLRLSGAIISNEIPNIWRTWWIGDALGIIIVTPVLLSWMGWKQKRPIAAWPGFAESVLFLILTALVAVRIFSGARSTQIMGSPEVYLLFVFVIWSALRYSTRATTSVVLLISAIAILGTTQGMGPFTGRSLSENLFFLQLFMGVLATTGMLLSAAYSEREAAEEKFRTVIESAPNAMIMMDQTSRIVLVNSQTEWLFGYRRNEILGHNIQMLIPKSLGSGAVDLGFEHLSTQNPSSPRDYWGIRKDGRELRVEVVSSPIKTAEGERVLCSISDVTDSRRSGDGHQFLNKTGIVLASSLDYRATLNEVAHLTLPKLADWCLIDLALEEIKQVAAAHLDPEKEKMAQELANNVTPQASLGRGVGFVTKTGESEIYPDVTDTQWMAETLGSGYPQILSELGAVSYMCVPLTARGRVLGAITFIYGESKRRYDAFTLFIAEKLARQAAMAIDNARLYSLAQEAIRDRDELMAIVSHDLRNPLFSVIQGASLLMEEQWPGEKGEFLSKISANIFRASNRMNRLVHDLLDLSKLEQGRIRIKPALCRIADLIDEALVPFEHSAAAKNLHLRMDLENADLQAFCDHDRTLQVIANLVDNAVRLTPAGGAVVVSGRQNEDEIEISVSDTGPGIPPDDLGRLFGQEWQRGKISGRGGGLGLSIADKLVKLHGGRIWAQNKKEGGSTFSFTLPLSAASTDKAGPNQSAPQPHLQEI